LGTVRATKTSILAGSDHERKREISMSQPAAAVSTSAAAEEPARGALMLGALGVVFGDIGTSPIYAFRESLRASAPAPQKRM
jgi:hypothetical protein